MHALHATAIGKALLSGADPAELDELLGPAPLRAYTRRTIVSPVRAAADAVGLFLGDGAAAGR